MTHVALILIPHEKRNNSTISRPSGNPCLWEDIITKDKNWRQMTTSLFTDGSIMEDGPDSAENNAWKIRSVDYRNIETTADKGVTIKGLDTPSKKLLYCYFFIFSDIFFVTFVKKS